jgi:large subunit ribosomal protein L13
MKKKTFVPKPETVAREWVLVDAKGKTLGRLSSQIARVLMGKHKPVYSPHVLCGDYVVVINSAKVRVTGKKSVEKEYDKYTGYPSGHKIKTLPELQERNPNLVIEQAVKGMLPKNRLAKSMFNSMKVYAGEEHPHVAQNPRKVEL